MVAARSFHLARPQSPKGPSIHVGGACHHIEEKALCPIWKVDAKRRSERWATNKSRGAKSQREGTAVTDSMSMASRGGIALV